MEDKQTVQEEPLTPRKKRAMVEYMGILFAAAFLPVAISLVVKVHYMQDNFDAASQGASENIEAIQRESSATLLLVQAQEAYRIGDAGAFTRCMDELSACKADLPEPAAKIYDSLLTLQAQQH